MSRELKIGLFLAFALLLLAVFIFIVGDLSVLFKKKGYSIYADFKTVAGLDRRTVVRMSGVKIGFVKDMRLRGDRAEVEISLYPAVKVRTDSKATLSSLGILGEKYVEIIPGGSKEFCKPGDVIRSLPSASFDQIGVLLMDVGAEIQDLSRSLQQLVGGEEVQADFRKTLRDMSALMTDIRSFFQDNRESIGKSVQESAETIRRFDRRVEDISKKLEEFVSLLNDIAEENRDPINTNLEDIRVLIREAKKTLQLLNESLEKINEGKGSLGKLIHDQELYLRAKDTLGAIEEIIQPVSEVRAHTGIQLDYYSRSEKIKPSLSLRVQSESGPLVFAQIIHNPWEDKFSYTAQGGIKIGPVTPRLGILESEIGAGLDWLLLKDKLVFSIEGYDWTRDPYPRFRLFARYSASKYFYFLMGLDDLALNENREFYLGLGFGER